MPHSTPATAPAPTPAPTPAPPRGLFRIGEASARHPYRVLAMWLLAVVAAAVANVLAGGTFNDDIDLSGTQSHTGAELLTASDPAAGGSGGKVVFHVESGSLQADAPQIQAAVSELGTLPHVLSASDPFSATAPTVSPDGRTAYTTVQFDVRPKTLGEDYVSDLDDAVAEVRDAGVQVEYGGALDELTRPGEGHAGEVVGLIVALIVLLVGFGSLFGAVLPLVTAIVSTVLGLSILGLVAAVVTLGTASPTLALMVGLGVGIDYALFLATRYRQLLLDGEDPVRAAGRAVATKGHAVLVAAGTVAVALLGLYASGISFIGGLGFAAVFTVATAAAGAVTLVPAAFGVLGRRIDRWSVRKPVAEASEPHGMWHRYAAAVVRRPWPAFVAGMLVLAVLTVPMFSMRLGHIDNGADPSSFTDKRAYDLISEGFGPGANGPLTVVVDVTGAITPPQQLAQTLQADLTGTADVARVSPIRPSQDGKLLIGTVIPTTSPQDEATSDLYDTLLNTTLPTALADTGAKGYLTGTTASQFDFQEVLVDRLPIIIGVVVLTAFLLILASFRSLLLAIKAAVLNLLSIAAAYGVLVAVFQWGWGSSLFGLEQTVPIEAYVPMMMFAIVFGLSMDYEVFLLSAVHEHYAKTGDDTASVREGLATTGRVITSAALIMISVFLAFTTSHVVVIKMLAVGLAVSVLIDAGIVRMLLVPAAMALFGRRTWWMPRWMDRVLPKISAEGHDVPSEAPTNPAPAPAAAVTSGGAN
ncbi:putative drug exporter of the RND superfamily [Quadrisphaera granulorum]|uniref:RND superfamily putative drug exporter n=1 Tax=Quadrisphaera granulorum TaxID=317664 RepID=A0A316A8J9_9ACTN|nr:MMPL family transporter [Quadrisphaera granulorum]PWJ53769.1 RND superfamily putative drug exporter [Quadrisphaera granulorum]SZE96526.1 putative drug exporter of the RND superfamily [Quadrisphaera granulorum]